jgi:ArsR family transcriptional regulator
LRYIFKAEFFKTLAHPLRIQILDALREGPLSVGHLREKLGVEQSTLSQQLAVLRARNFVTTERQGTTIRYSVRDPDLWRLLDAALAIFENHLIGLQGFIDDVRAEAEVR